MSLPLALLLQVGAGALVISPAAPSVGDTITVVRTIEAQADARARAQPLGSSLLVEPLADPAVSRGPEGIVVRYTFAMFEAGRHAVGVPPVELVYRDGRVELVPADTAWVAVRSVLPPGDSLPEPAASLGPIARFPTRSTPLFALVGLVLLGITTWAVARRHTGPRSEPAETRTPAPVPPLMRWAAAGEARAVAAIAADRLRTRIAELVPEADRALSADECIAVLDARHPDWPIRDLTDGLHGLERARFAPAVASDVALLIDQVDVLIAALPRGGAA